MASENRFLGLTPKGWAGFFLLVFALPYLADLFLPVEWVGAAQTAIENAGGVVSRSPVVTVVQWIALVFFAPVAYTTYFLWVDLLGHSTNPFVEAEAGGPVFMITAVLWIVFVTWLFWWVIARTLAARGLNVIGLWDPFRRTGFETRRWALKFWVRLRDAFEIARRFGRRSTGGWAGFIEVLANRFYPGDVFLGRPKLPFAGAMLRPIGLPTEKHMVTIAGTGSGKSTAALIPNLCIHEGSLLCIDPKGELARITARRRGRGGNGVKGMGQAVHVLDPFDVTGFGVSSSYNVFDEMAAVAGRDSDRPVSYAGRIADALVKPFGEKDSYWDEAAKTYLRGLILYVFVHEPSEKRTLSRLRSLITQGDVEGHRKAVEAGTIKAGDLTPHEVLIEKMRSCRDGPYGEPIAAAAASTEMMGANQKGGVITTAQEHTVFLDAPEIARVTSRSDFRLDDLKRGAVSVYLCLPPQMVSGKEGRWLRMFVLLFIDMMMRVRKAPKPPVLLAIDEFPNLGRLDGIELVAPMMRSYGVRFWAIGQDIEQFKRVYPKSWGSFIGGAEAVQFMANTHPETVKLISELLGRHRVVETSVANGKKTKRVLEKPLLDAEQVPRILSPERKHQIIWRGNARPMLLKIAPYFAYMPSWYYAPDERYQEKLRRRIWRPWFRKSRDRKPPITPRASPPPPPPSPPSAPPPPDTEAKKEPTRPAPKPPSRPKREREKTPTAPAVKAELREPPPKPGEDKQGWAAYLAKERDAADPPRPEPVQPDPKNSDAIAELNSLIGLSGVKTRIAELSSLMRLQQRRRKLRMKELTITHHLVFTGNPGTGKTTVARIVGRIYKDLGALKSGHVVEVGRADLIAGYVGQTALKVKKVVEEALDGVLFIDEAYSLIGKGSRDFGNEAVESILTAMENHRDRLAVIVAGYPEEMKQFIASNPGLKSRFTTVIEFEDYAAAELAEIFELMCSDLDCRLSLEAKVELQERMKAVKQEAGPRFGNGRVVRNLVEECLTRQAMRLAKRKTLTRADITMIEVEDLPGAPPPPRPEKPPVAAPDKPAQPAPGKPPVTAGSGLGLERATQSFAEWYARQKGNTVPVPGYSPDSFKMSKTLGKDNAFTRLYDSSYARSMNQPDAEETPTEDGTQDETFDLDSLIKRAGLSEKNKFILSDKFSMPKIPSLKFSKDPPKKPGKKEGKTDET